MLSYKKFAMYTGFQLFFLGSLYITQFSIKTASGPEVIREITSRFSYYDLSLFVTVLMPIFIFSLSVFMKEKTVYQTIRMRKEELYLSKCIVELLEISKFMLIYSLIGATVFLKKSSDIEFSEFIKQNVIFFFFTVIYAQLYTMMGMINRSNNKVVNSFITVAITMVVYFTFKDVFLFFNLNYNYYIMNLNMSIVVYLPILLSISIFLFVTNYLLFKERDIL